MDLVDEEELEQQHGLPPRALRTASRALQRWALHTLGAGRGVSVPHVGRLVFVAGAGGEEDRQLVFELSDGLTRGHAVQLGRGVSRGVGAAAVRGLVEEVNHTQLALRYTAGGLSKTDVAQALKIFTQRMADAAKARRPASLDLGAGTLTVRGGLAEFRFALGTAAPGSAAASSVCSGVAARPRAASAVGAAGAPAAGAGAGAAVGGGSCVSGRSQQQPGPARSDASGQPRDAGSCCASRLTADVLLRHQQLQQHGAAGSLVGSAVGKSRVSAAASQRPSHVRSSVVAPGAGKGRSAAGVALGAAAASDQQQPQQQEPQKPKKPSSVALPPGAAAPASAAAMVQSVKAARDAAKANARARVATFVLPCGGPGDEGAPAPAPQGRSKPAAAKPVALPGTGDGGLPPAVAAALALAEERAAKERAARARQEAEAVAAMAARKAALDAEAEAIKGELRKKKQLLATTLASQVLERQITALEGKGAA